MQGHPRGGDKPLELQRGWSVRCEGGIGRTWGWTHTPPNLRRNRGEWRQTQPAEENLSGPCWGGGEPSQDRRSRPRT